MVLIVIVKTVWFGVPRRMQQLLCRGSSRGTPIFHLLFQTFFSKGVGCLPARCQATEAASRQRPFLAISYPF
jgi:hypothetical protein